MAELSVHAALGDETSLPLVPGFHFLEGHTFLKHSCVDLGPLVRGHPAGHSSSGSPWPSCVKVHLSIFLASSRGTEVELRYAWQTMA